MFFHKSKPLTTAFACAAAAMIIGVAANPAQADPIIGVAANRVQADPIIFVAANPAQADRRGYCGERDGCNYPTGGIVQSERDGVNYFYGGMHMETPSLSYIYVINSNLDQPPEEPIRPSSLLTSGFELPLSKHRFRLNKEHRKWHGRHGRKWDFPMGPHSGHKFMGP